MVAIIDTLAILWFLSGAGLLACARVVSGKQIRVGSDCMAEHRSEAGMDNTNQAIFLDGERA